MSLCLFIGAAYKYRALGGGAGKLYPPPTFFSEEIEEYLWKLQSDIPRRIIGQGKRLWLFFFPFDQEP